MRLGLNHAVTELRGVLAFIDIVPHGRRQIVLKSPQAWTCATFMGEQENDGTDVSSSRKKAVHMRVQLNDAILQLESTGKLCNPALATVARWHEW